MTIALIGHWSRAGKPSAGSRLLGLGSPASTVNSVSNNIGTRRSGSIPLNLHKQPSVPPDCAAPTEEAAGTGESVPAGRFGLRPKHVGLDDSEAAQAISAAGTSAPVATVPGGRSSQGSRIPLRAPAAHAAAAVPAWAPAASTSEPVQNQQHPTSHTTLGHAPPPGRPTDALEVVAGPANTREAVGNGRMVRSADTASAAEAGGPQVGSNLWAQGKSAEASDFLGSPSIGIWLRKSARQREEGMPASRSFRPAPLHNLSLSSPPDSVPSPPPAPPSSCPCVSEYVHIRSK